MSYDSMVDHLSRELARGAARRRRNERRARRVGVAAVAVLLVLGAFGTVTALRTDDDENARITTTPGATDTTTTSPVPPPPTVAATGEQLAVCGALLDFRSSTNIFDDAVSKPLRAALAEAGTASGDPELARLAISIAGVDFTDVDDTGQARGAEAYFAAMNELRARCKAFGHPDFNPVIVPAELPAKPNVDLSAYGTLQLFGPPSGVPALNAEGRDLSPVSAASAGPGTYVASWSSGGAPGRRSYCVVAGTGRDSVMGCGSDAIEQPNTSGRALATAGAFESTNPRSLTLVAAPNVAFAVLDVSGKRFVQQPMLGYLVFVWDEGLQSPRAEHVVRAYDTNGVQLGCLTFDNRTC